MEHSLPAATWFWLFAPMTLLVVLSFISYIVDKTKGD